MITISISQNLMVETRPDLNIVLRKLLGKSAATSSGWVYSVVYRDLAVLMVEPGVNILTTLLQDLLPQHD